MERKIKYSQNFLTSDRILNQVIKKMALKKSDMVYEIGTGKGHLTLKLAEHCKSVHSVELDNTLFNFSSKKLQDNKNIRLINQDILKFKFSDSTDYKIVGNIPYNLSTKIVKKTVFESRASEIFLVVEEGFYKRMLDIHRTLGLLLRTQVSIQLLLKIPSKYFHPKPKVSSVLIKLTRHKSNIKSEDWTQYLYFVSKWVNQEYRILFTKNQFHQAIKHAKIKDLTIVNYEQVLSVYHSYLLFNRKNSKKTYNKRSIFKS
ncbi:23S ribosomal RNA methyltransferase Erm [Vagococcus elongatus]|uniref:rRNA adenine N-6-methyltransferase n=1 Tax=Vagococcus elongatus TaxID=180344 RepID=A0A430AQ12_9ENTE|nr:23S ribosomal RNA methyltransferase Erm [Vagococcus elongatus]RSU10146.1 23S rRNA (adenine(2058)-N(6))-methyltransferase Erm(B) [Vagococcus elongatus]